MTYLSFFFLFIQQVLKGPLAYKVPEAGLGQPARVQGSSLGLLADTRLLGKPAQTRRFFSKGVER